MRRRAARLQPGGVGDHDLGAVIHPGFGSFPEGQLVALDLEDGTTGFLYLKGFNGKKPRRDEGALFCVCVRLLTMMLPPPGMWLALLREPTLA